MRSDKILRRSKNLILTVMRRRKWNTQTLNRSDMMKCRNVTVIWLPSVQFNFLFHRYSLDLCETDSMQIFDINAQWDTMKLNNIEAKCLNLFFMIFPTIESAVLFNASNMIVCWIVIRHDEKKMKSKQVQNNNEKSYSIK